MICNKGRAHLRRRTLSNEQMWCCRSKDAPLPPVGALPVAGIGWCRGENRSEMRWNMEDLPILVLTSVASGFRLK